VVIKKFRYILDLIERNLESQSIFFKINSKNIFFKIISQKKDIFDLLREKIRSKWSLFKQKNENWVIKKTYTTFLYDNFHDFFKFIVQNIFELDFNRFELESKEIISNTNLIFEYNFYFSDEEYREYEKFSKRDECTLFGMIFPVGVLYYIISALGIIIRKTIQEKIFILLDASVLKNNENNKTLKFLIFVRNSKEKIYNNYLKMVSFYFLKQFKGIPEWYYNKLLEGREKLYKIALEEYNKTKEKLIDLLYYFYKKCKLLQNFSPLLDFLNFVCSRVEDSIFSKIDIINKEFLDNFDYSVKKKNSIINIFNFLDKKSTLYSTFQANNLPSPRAQFNLFLLYMKYYFSSGLEALEVGDILFLPEIFKSALNEYNKSAKNVINANSIKNIEKFLNYFSVLSNIENINLFFKKIFKKDLLNTNYNFFRFFLESFNSKFAMVVDQENLNFSEENKEDPITFDIVVDHICRILYVLIAKIFLREHPNDASENFIDPRGRYIGKNIALRVLELFIFQEINFSDDIWPEFLISINKDKFKKNLKKYIEIPDKFFYTNNELAIFIITYNFRSFLQDRSFEEWLITDIIKPLNTFILKIKNSVKDPSNNIEVYEKLIKYFLEDIEDKKIIKDFKFVCQQIAPFWKISA